MFVVAITVLHILCCGGTNTSFVIVLDPATSPLHFCAALQLNWLVLYHPEEKQGPFQSVISLHPPFLLSLLSN